MTQEELQDIKDWLLSEEAGHKYAAARPELGYYPHTGLACAHVRALLEEVERLQAGLAAEKKRADDLQETLNDTDGDC